MEGGKAKLHACIDQSLKEAEETLKQHESQKNTNAYWKTLATSWKRLATLGDVLASFLETCLATFGDVGRRSGDPLAIA